MRTRHLLFLFLSPILPVIGTTFGVGCGNAVTLGTGDTTDGGGGDATTDTSTADTATTDSPVTGTCALPLETGPCKALMKKWGYDATLGGCRRFDYGGCDGNANRFDTQAACTAACGGTPVTGTAVMTVDFVSCTGITASVTKATAPDGKTWTLDLKGTCGALGLVDVFVVSKDDIAYPQSCGTGTGIQMSVGGEGDAGFLAYDSRYGGSCSVASGPSTANQATGIKLTGTVGNAALTATHTFTYAAADAP